jgi:poly(hydroxyalkanoate) synthase III subunit E
MHGVTPTDPPWLQAWQDAQREIARFAAAGPATSSSPISFAQQRLSDYATGYAGLAAAAIAQWQAGGASLDTFSAPLVGHYQRLFTPPGLVPANPEAAQGGAAWLRMQQAQARYAQLALAIATDAGRRLVAALSASGPAAPPITTLCELHALWIECGEAAWAAAAHREEFAGAQAELLAAHVELAASARPG